MSGERHTPAAQGLRLWDVYLRGRLVGTLEHETRFQALDHAFALYGLAAVVHRHEEATAAAERCEREGTREAANNARKVARDADAAAAAAAYAAYAAYAAAAAAAAAADAYADKVLGYFAEEVVQILVAMKVPAVRWLDLAPLAA